MCLCLSLFSPCNTQASHTLTFPHPHILPPSQVIELPLMNPELFQRVGITPPKGCLLYGPPGGYHSNMMSRSTVVGICLCFNSSFFSLPFPLSFFPFPLHVGTGKTLLARAVAKQLDANFLKVVSSAIVDKYIGESARLIREMFGM